ncbi:MAG: hypothetical protein RL318_2058 [Fibrobacterota bacterium]|jgi:TM2 domain-containing membrane protein YozV
MNSVFVVTTVLALALNALAWFLKLGYLASVATVFGSVTVFLLVQSRRALLPSDWKLFAGFFLFSNLATLGLEKLMLGFNVWGFSHVSRYLTGYTWLGAPIEEYIYWAMCPAIVALLYLLQGRTRVATLPDPGYLKPLVAFVEGLDKIKAKSDDVKYVPDQSVDADSHYSAGKKRLVYIWVQVAILSTILLLLRSFHGSWRNTFTTTIAFTACAFPNELYCLHAGYWVYNTNTLLGVFLWDIPLEGYLMYVLSPICACMCLDIANRKIFGKDI